MVNATAESGSSGASSDGGSVDFPLLSSSDLESIQVDRGSASPIFGTDAFAGVLHLTTGRPSEKPFSLFGGVEYSSFNGIRFHNGMSGTIQDDLTGLGGAFAYYFKGGRDQNRGFRDNGEYRITDFDIKTEYHLPDEGGRLFVHVKHAGVFADQLLGVLVGSDDDGVYPLLLGAPGYDCQDVVRLVPGGCRFRHALCREQFVDERDLALQGFSLGPGPDGKLWRIRFGPDGEPLAPEIVARGLAFPDAVSVLPGDLQAAAATGTLVLAPPTRAPEVRRRGSAAGLLMVIAVLLVTLGAIALARQRRRRPFEP